MNVGVGAACNHGNHNVAGGDGGGAAGETVGDSQCTLNSLDTGEYPDGHGDDQFTRVSLIFSRKKEKIKGEKSFGGILR